VLRQNDLPVQPGDVIVLYTDGVTEAKNPHGKMFSLAKLRQCVTTHGALHTAETVLGKIIDDINDFISHTEQYDDITLAVISIS